ncbi:sensor histidine kinase [Millisia brevis]|uniref:sensor histidine kinase n=1 Tax=Millisia brevis TaxID=264148 RepID=UPI00082BF1E3|nr:ATP-binding protein [Millisia brevis]
MVIAIVCVAGALGSYEMYVHARSTAEKQSAAIASSLASAPSTLEALLSDDPTARLQSVTEGVRAVTGAAFITIMSPDGTRFTHTDPAQIGGDYLGSRDEALAGGTYTEVYTGTLGPSIRTIAPVVDDRGDVVGLVAAGFTLDSLTASWQRQLPIVGGIAVTALAFSFTGLWLLRRRLLRQTGGLAPDELRVMYEHHDAVLHAVSEGLVVVERGRPVLVNDEARRLLGLTESGRDEDLPAFITDGVEPIIDETHVAAGGRILLVNRAPVPDRAQSAVITIRDRTELQSATGSLAAMTQFAEHLRSQAHEWGNRMHTIASLVEMGQTEEAVRLATGDFAVRDDDIARVSALIRDPGVAALLLGKLARARDRSIAMTVTDDSRLDASVSALLTPAELHTVVGNLVDNALDAADPDDPWVEITVIGDANELRVTVADSGPGMDSEQFELARRRGYSTKSGGDELGRGLGLHLIDRIVDRRGGTTTAEQTYGSVLSVHLIRPGVTADHAIPADTA